MSKMSYQNRMRLLAGICAAATIVFGISAGYLSRIGEPGEHLWITYPVLLLLGAGLFALVWRWWRSLDDVQKGGQLSSWYWGGCTGAFAFLLWLIASREQHSEFGMGAATMFGTQVAGFVIMWLVWKIRGLGTPE